MLQLIADVLSNTSSDLQWKMLGVGLFWSALGVYAFSRILTIRAWTPGADAVADGRGRSRETLGRRGDPYVSVSQNGLFARTFGRIGAVSAVMSMFTMAMISNRGCHNRETLDFKNSGYFYVEDESSLEKFIRAAQDFYYTARKDLEKLADALSYRAYTINKFLSYKKRQIHWAYKHL